MITFYKGNVYTKIDKKRITGPEVKSLHEILSVKIPGYYFSRKYKMGRWDGYKHFFNRLTGSFYSGLLGYVIPKLSHDYFVVDERTPVPSRNNSLSLNGIELRDYQTRMIQDALRHERGIISAPPNAGKTEIACGIIQVLGLPAVFLTHRITLLDQTKSRFEKRLGIEAGIFGAKQRVFKDINVMSIVSVYKELDNPEILNILKQSPVVISDECHRVSGNMWATILQKCPAFYRYGLSATALMRDEVSNMIVRGMTGDEITSVTNQELTEWGISAEASVYLFDMNRFGIGPVLSRRHTFDDAYDTGIVNNPQRNTLIVDSARHFLAMGKSVFIIVHRIEHGRILSEIFRRVGLEVPFISGEENLDFIKSRLKEFEKRTLKCLVSSSISDEGLDIPSMDVLILGVGNKSALKTIQRVGRGLRKKDIGENVVSIIDFIDRCSPYLYRHSIARSRVYVSMDFKIHEVLDRDWKEVAER
jgi:superfamily II DNA or RNA helicase